MLLDVANAIAANLSAMGIDAPVAVGKGRLYKRDGAPPKITIFPMGADAMPPKQTRARAPGQDPKTVTKARRLWTRGLHVRVHIWAADPTGVDDYGACESLLASLTKAVQKTLSRESYAYLGEDDPEGDEAVTAKGRIIIARYRFDLAITDTEPARASGVTPNLSTAIEDPDPES